MRLEVAARKNVSRLDRPAESQTSPCQTSATRVPIFDSAFVANHSSVARCATDSALTSSVGRNGGRPSADDLRSGHRHCRRGHRRAPCWTPGRRRASASTLRLWQRRLDRRAFAARPPRPDVRRRSRHRPCRRPDTSVDAAHTTARMDCTKQLGVRRLRLRARSDARCGIVKVSRREVLDVKPSLTWTTRSEVTPRLSVD